MPELNILVASRSEAAAILCSPTRSADVRFLISIGEVEDRRPAGYGKVRDRIRLLFADTEDEFGPTHDDIERLVRFAERVARQPATVLAHCQSGISRSSAAAYIVYCVALGPGSETAALNKVLETYPYARPNRKMVALADQILGRNDAMIYAIDNKLDDA